MRATKRKVTKDEAEIRRKKIAGLAKAQRELFEKLRDIDLAFLHGIPARSGPVFTVSVAVVGFVASAAVFGMGRWLQSQEPWIKLGAAGLLLGVLASLVVAVWSGLESLRPSDFDQTPARKDFIDLALPQISDDDVDAGIDAFMAELTRNEIERNQVWIRKRMRGLTVAVWALRVGFVLAIVLVASSVIISISAAENPNAGQQFNIYNRNDPARNAAGNAGTPDPTAGNPAGAHAGDSDQGRRPAVRNPGSQTGQPERQTPIERK